MLLRIVYCAPSKHRGISIIATTTGSDHQRCLGACKNMLPSFGLSRRAVSCRGTEVTPCWSGKFGKGKKARWLQEGIVNGGCQRCKPLIEKYEVVKVKTSNWVIERMSVATR